MDMRKQMFSKRVRRMQLHVRVLLSRKKRQTVGDLAFQKLGLISTLIACLELNTALVNLCIFILLLV